MSNGFVHSVKVPRIYKITADIVRRVREDGASLKSLIYEKKHPNVSGIFGLSVNTLQALPQLDQLLSKTNILVEQPRLNPWLARVLITELLWGKKCLQNNSKPILTLLTYEHKLREEARNLNCTVPIVHKQKVQRPRYVRVNTFLLSVEDAISKFQDEGWQLLPRSATYSSYLLSLSRLSEPYFIQDLHIPELLVFPPWTSFHEHPGYRKGMLILQDKASCLPVHLLNPVSGSVVLDMCAAPGMKATYVAAKMQNNGIVYAVEIDSKRYDTLCSLIETTQSFCVQSINQDTLTLDPKQYSQVEYILVDPSCSGSGIVDRPKQSETDGKPEPDRLQNLQSFQVYLLRYALLNFPNAKRITYSTCSLHPEENEQVIDEVLSDIGQAYRLVPARDMLGDSWINFSSEEYNCTDKCLYSKPDVDFCNGFFVAVFERDFAVALPICKRKGGNVNSIDASVGVNVDKPAPDDETVSRKRKKRGKRKKREVSATDEQMKNQQGDVEFKSEEENEEQVKKRKKEVDICVPSDNNCKEISNEEQLKERKKKKIKKEKEEKIAEIEESLK